MIPIHALLARISRAPAFGRGEFVIGYYDRVAKSAAPGLATHQSSVEPFKNKRARSSAGPLL